MLPAGEWRERGFDQRTADGIREALPPDIPASLASVLAARGVAPSGLADFLAPDLAKIPPPAALPGAVEAADAILDAVEHGREIVV